MLQVLLDTELGFATGGYRVVNTSSLCSEPALVLNTPGLETDDSDDDVVVIKSAPPKLEITPTKVWYCVP